MNKVIEKLVIISNDKINILEFDIEITGVDEEDMEVRFVIENKDLNLGFNSKKISKKRWSVEIPPMKMLNSAEYPYHISVIVDGYSFIGVEGKLVIVEDSKIKASGVIVNPKTDSKKVDTVKKKAISKKKTTSKPSPLKIKAGEELLNDLMPDTTSKKEKPLNADIIKVIKKAKVEISKKKKENVSNKTDKTSKELKDNINKIISDAEKEIENKKAENKKPIKKKVTKKDATIPPPTKTDEGTTADQPSSTFSAKNIAADLIKSVTGIGKVKKKEVTEKTKSNDNKITDILNEANKKDQPKTDTPTKPSHKKIIRGGKVVEVDVVKENKIKEVLNEEVEDQVITTSPVNKTIH